MKDWEKEFDNLSLEKEGWPSHKWQEDFISSLLQEQRKEIREKVEKVGKAYFETHKGLMYMPYDQAIQDIKDILDIMITKIDQE